MGSCHRSSFPRRSGIYPTIIGIDPSRVSGTGLACVRFEPSGPVVVDSTCIKPNGPDANRPHHEQERQIANQCAHLCALYLSSGGIIAIEQPPEVSAPVRYRARNGTIATRVLVTASQWRLIGRLAQALENLAPVVYVSPGEAKAAAGIPARSKRKPVREIELLCNIKLSGHKYQREAQADAIAVALAAQSIARRAALSAAKRPGGGAFGD